MRLASLLALAAACLGCQADAPAEDVPAPVPAPDGIASALALGNSGLQLLPSDGPAAALAFGSPFGAAVTAVVEARGEPAERGTNPECGAGPLDYVSWPDGLTLYGQDSLFAGWFVNDAQAGYATLTGLAVGSVRDAVEVESAEAEVRESTLGTEFDAGGIFGLLDGAGDAASVTSLWAGTTCAFR